jgi:hypothetical protein
MDYEAKDWVLIRMIVLAAEYGAEDDPEFEQAIEWIHDYYGSDAGEMVSTIQMDPARIEATRQYVDKLLATLREEAETEPALWTTITARIRMFRIVWHVKVARAFKAFKTFIDELRSRK